MGIITVDFVLLSASDIYVNFIHLRAKISKNLNISNSYHSRHFGVPSQND